MSYLTSEQISSLGLSEEVVARTDSAIDILTYSRINAVGFENLTAFQQRIIRECAVEIAKFFLENRDVLDIPLSSYSINGVAMQFNFNEAVYYRNGVIIPKITYRKLLLTDLCRGGF